jgi:5-formaminoimidazole-4-carboxamide-1-(beta)-D-ribofuranosyl 5'-monophosphate synthetase
LGDRALSLRRDVEKVEDGYDPSAVTVGILGSHSAEEVGVAAKAIGLPCLVVYRRGREDLYVTYNSALFDHVILLDRFSDIA